MLLTLEPSKITPFFYNNLFDVWGDSPPPPPFPPGYALAPFQFFIQTPSIPHRREVYSSQLSNPPTPTPINLLTVPFLCHSTHPSVIINPRTNTRFYFPIPVSLGSDHDPFRRSLVVAEKFLIPSFSSFFSLQNASTKKNAFTLVDSHKQKRMIPRELMVATLDEYLFVGAVAPIMSHLVRANTLGTGIGRVETNPQCSFKGPLQWHRLDFFGEGGDARPLKGYHAPPAGGPGVKAPGR